MPMSPELQTLWDLVAIAAALVSAVFTYMRRTMLSRLLVSWHDAPGWVQLALVFQTGWLFCVALSIVFGKDAHATPREALSYVFGAAVSVIVAVNFGRTGRREFPAGAAVAANGSGVKPEAERPAGRSFADRNDPRPPAH